MYVDARSIAAVAGQASIAISSALHASLSVPIQIGSAIGHTQNWRIARYRIDARLG
jgi:hypothetical protein